MKQPTLPEVWLRGAVEGIPPLLQPVAHALLQAKEEVAALMTGFPEVFLWNKPAGAASVAFHLQHMTGVIDRLFTYAKGMMLTNEQLEALSAEGKPQEGLTGNVLIEKFVAQVAVAIDQLKNTAESTLTDIRGVGRAQLPSTVTGILMHAAEHTMRHLGQLIVTVKVLKDNV